MVLVSAQTGVLADARSRILGSVGGISDIAVSDTSVGIGTTLLDITLFLTLNGPGVCCSIGLIACLIVCYTQYLE